MHPKASKDAHRACSMQHQRLEEHLMSQDGPESILSTRRIINSPRASSALKTGPHVPSKEALRACPRFLLTQAKAENYLAR